LKAWLFQALYRIFRKTNFAGLKENVFKDNHAVFWPKFAFDFLIEVFYYKLLLEVDGVPHLLFKIFVEELNGFYEITASGWLIVGNQNKQVSAKPFHRTLDAINDYFQPRLVQEANIYGFPLIFYHQAFFRILRLSFFPFSLYFF